MAVIGGPIESVGINGRTFAVTADTDSNRKIGGYENEVLAFGDGSSYMKKTRVPFSVDGITIGIDDTRGDHEYIEEVKAMTDFVPVTVTYASGAVWQGSAQITGETAYSSANGTMGIALSGTGSFTQQ